MLLSNQYIYVDTSESWTCKFLTWNWFENPYSFILWIFQVRTFIQMKMCLGRCYDHNFLQKVAFLITFLNNLALFWVKNANFAYFLAKVFKKS
jgi:hypothetical protein